jgi:hypothetical protein
MRLVPNAPHFCTALACWAHLAFPGDAASPTINAESKKKICQTVIRMYMYSKMYNLFPMGHNALYCSIFYTIIAKSGRYEVAFFVCSISRALEM